MTAKQAADLDVFSQRRLPALCERFVGLQKDHALAMTFSDAELAVLDEIGMLPPLELDDLAAAQRLVR